MDEPWLQTVESYGTSIGTDDNGNVVVEEWRNGVKLEVDSMRAVEIIDSMRFALGENIADVAGLPKIGGDG